MIALIRRLTNLDATEAYMLCSLAADVRVPSWSTSRRAATSCCRNRRWAEAAADGARAEWLALDTAVAQEHLGGRRGGVVSAPAFRFELLASDGAARRGRLHTAHGTSRRRRSCRSAPQATVKAMTPDDAARDRRRDRARQHLPPDAAPGRRAGRAARRAASVHGLAGPDPHRFRRLPGDVAGRAAHAGRGRRDLRLAPRRQPPSPHARARGRDPGPARCRR